MDFEVACERKLQGWQEAHVRYGAYEFELDPNRKKYKFHTTVRFDGRSTTVPPPPADKLPNTYQLRLAVKDGTARTFVDGKEVAAETVGPAAEPWLMLHTSHRNTAEVRNLTITGAPTSPDKVDLLANDDLGLWQAYHGNVVGACTRNTTGNFWVKRGEELDEYGKKPGPPEGGRPARVRDDPESALFYQRPFLEDAAVEYDFYYDPDKALVHPARDRLVFLLEPDGVKLHRLTDGRADRSGLPADNATDEPSNRRGPAEPPLKPKAWNTVRLGGRGGYGDRRPERGAGVRAAD